jgi:type IV fimbrial biogenesis protein FimT
MLALPSHAQSGVTLVELSIGMAIVALLLLVGMPSFGTWIQNTEIRNAAEAIQNGLQLSRAEALRRNTSVQLVLTSVLGGGVGSDWTISCVTPIADVDGDGIADCPGTGMVPTEIQKRPATEGSRNAAVAAAQSTVVFNGLGRMTTPAVAANIVITNPTGGTCATTGPMRCLSVVVSIGGQVRMCDPALASTDPRGC